MSELGRPFLSPELRGLIEQERRAPDPPDQVKREVAGRIDRSLRLGGVMVGPSSAIALEPPPLPGSSTPSVPSPPPSFFGWKAAASAVAVVVAGAAMLTLAVRSPKPAIDRGTQPIVAIEDKPIVVAPTAPNEILLGDVEMQANDAQPAHPHRVASSHRLRPVDTLSAERTVLDGARAALVRRDPEGALNAVRAHQRSFPRGQLVEERESMRVQALALANEDAALRTAGAKFLHRFPQSMFRPAVEQALENQP